MQYFISVFISAFLVFQIQPIISKIILPWFGGGASVWTTCMLFFQFFLLVGYLYAFILSKIFRVKYQVIAHLTCLSLCLILLPNSISDLQSISISGSPTWAVLKVLFLGLFLLLSYPPWLRTCVRHPQVMMVGSVTVAPGATSLKAFGAGLTLG